MTVHAFRAKLPCPACGTVTLVGVAVRESRPTASGTLRDGAHAGRAAECEACWRERAMAIQAARESLRSRGLLGATGPRELPTFMGALLPEEGPDALENAIASELLRRGVCLDPSRGAEANEVTVLVAAGEPSVAEATPALSLA